MDFLSSNQVKKSKSCFFLRMIVFQDKPKYCKGSMEIMDTIHWQHFIDMIVLERNPSN